MAQDLFIFLHIPRTGGTTLNSIFSENFQEEEIVSIYRRDDFSKAAKEIPRKMDRLRLIQGHFLDDGTISELAQSRRAKVVSFLRHPVDRLVSEYLFLKNWPHSHMYKIIGNSGISFADYVTLEDKTFRYRAQNFMTRVFSRMSFSGIPSPEVEKTALEHARSYNFLGFTEFFDVSLLLLGDLMGLGSIHYERRNMLSPALKETVGESDRALAAEHNAADIRLYEILRADFTAGLNNLPGEFNERLGRFRLINDKFNKVSGLLNKKYGLDKAAIINPKRTWEY